MQESGTETLTNIAEKLCCPKNTDLTSYVIARGQSFYKKTKTTLMAKTGEG